MIDWILSFFKKKKPVEPMTLEHRGMKAYFSAEMIQEFEKANLDYVNAFKQSVDEILDEEEQDEDNPYR